MHFRPSRLGSVARALCWEVAGLSGEELAKSQTLDVECELAMHRTWRNLSRSMDTTILTMLRCHYASYERDWCEWVLAESWRVQAATLVYD